MENVLKIRTLVASQRCLDPDQTASEEIGHFRTFTIYRYCIEKEEYDIYPGNPKLMMAILKLYSVSVPQLS